MSKTNIYIDIGSTFIKLIISKNPDHQDDIVPYVKEGSEENKAYLSPSSCRVERCKNILSVDSGIFIMESIRRCYELKVQDQVESIIQDFKKKYPDASISICSSANGGIRVGIIALTEIYSGQIASMVANSVGANVRFVHTPFRDSLHTVNVESVDLLILIGGIGVEKSVIVEEWLRTIHLPLYGYKKLLFCCHKDYIALFKQFSPIQVENPISNDLKICSNHLSDLIRTFYLDDLSQRDDIKYLQKYSNLPICATPYIVSAAFKGHRNFSIGDEIAYPFVAIDIGGATTDIHFGLESVSNQSVSKHFGRTVFRLVMTELGTFASKQSVIDQAKKHIKLYDILMQIYDKASILETHQNLKNNNAEECLLAYLCFFFSIEKMISGYEGVFLDFSKVQTILLTGGASQIVDLSIVRKLFNLLDKESSPVVVLDKKYLMWHFGFHFVAEENSNELHSEIYN